MRLFFIILLLSSCSSNSGKRSNFPTTKIERKADAASEYSLPIPKRGPPPVYPWDQKGKFTKITKEHFRCKGSHSNPVRISQKNGETVRFYDCGGAEKHSLPLRNQQEYIHPILIDLLNEIQEKTQKTVVITSGHRCPEHHAYAGLGDEDPYSKHLIGAEVSFYVQGYEEDPEKILHLIFDYYQLHPKYEGLKEFQNFSRYEKNDTNVSTAPWMNKEIFVKLFKKEEGRDFDNRHPYPYLSIQVRYDWELNERVSYSWDKARRNFYKR